MGQGTGSGQAWLDAVVAEHPHPVAILELERDEARDVVDFVVRAVNDRYALLVGLARPEVIGRFLGELSERLELLPSVDHCVHVVETGEGREAAFELPEGGSGVRCRVSPLPNGVMLTFPDAGCVDDPVPPDPGRLRVLAGDVTDLVIVLDGRGGAGFVSASVREVLGIDEAEFTALGPLDVVHPDHRRVWEQALDAARAHPGVRQSLTVRLRHRDGTWRWLEGDLVDLADEPAVDGVIAHLRDVTSRQDALEALAFHALHDQLTGLPTRTLVVDRIERAQARASGRPRSGFAVFVVGIDRFTVVNDSFGHNAGDQVLVEIATRLQGAVRGTDTVGRIGADHFVALCEPLAGTAAVVAAAERLLQVCREPVEIDGRTIHLTASVGVAVGGHPDDDPESILRDADSALAVAKRRGRDRHELFEEGVRDLLLWRLDTEQGLHQALANGEFELHYQPIWNLESGRIVAAEALLRWNHPERGLIPPPEFFSVAEDSGMIVPIGDWVLKEACAQRGAWSDVPGADDFHTVWVNVSAVQLTRADFPAKVSAALDAHGLQPHQVGLEITETVLMEADDNAMAGLEALHRMGCPIAIDDFGTGYASLTYLRRLRSDLVKIDQSFVARMTSSPEDRSIVAAVIDLSHALALQVSAEGVETLEQLEALHELGCDTACGYLLARPGSPDVVRRLLVAETLLPTRH